MSDRYYTVRPGNKSKKNKARISLNKGFDFKGLYKIPGLYVPL
jgi:hypothetical protein